MVEGTDTKAASESGRKRAVLILENGLIAFNIFGGAINLIICGIVAYKKQKPTYRWLFIFEAALLFYAACILISHHYLDGLHRDLPAVWSVIANYAFLFMFLVWNRFLLVRKEVSERTGRETALLVMALVCAVLWTMDSIFFTDAFFVQNLAGNSISTLAGLAFMLMVIVCYVIDLKHESNRMIWVITITLIVYIIYIQYIDVSTGTEWFDAGILQVITVHSCLASCAVISLMVLIFALLNVAKEISIDEDERMIVSAEQLKNEYGISRRELDVLNLIYRGATNQEIAEELFISENTVKKHVNNIFKKLSVSTRVDLMSTYKITFTSKN